MARVQLSGVGVTFRVFDAQERSFKRRILPGGDRVGLQIEALADIDLTLEPGSRVALLGTSSSGKTTLMRVMAGLLPPLSGRAVIDGVPGSVFSMGFGIAPEASLADLAYAHALLMGLPNREARAAVRAILDYAEISDGECRAHVAPPGILFRLGIATIICLGADIVLLDEVLDNIDPRFYDKFEQAFDKLTADGGILVMAERSRELVTRFCREAVVLLDGRVTGRGALDELLPQAGVQLTF